MAWAPDYCTVTELKAYLRIGDTDDDTELGDAISAASRAVDRSAGRQFGAVAAPEERTYPARWDRADGEYTVEIDDLMTTTGLVVTVAGAEVASTGYTLYPLNAPQKGRPWTRLHLASAPSTVLIEATWGWTSVPGPVKAATKIQSSRLFSRRNSPYGVAGSPEMGSEMRLLAKVDADVEVIVNPYRRWWGAR